MIKSNAFIVGLVVSAVTVFMVLHFITTIRSWRYINRETKFVPWDVGGLTNITTLKQTYTATETHE